MTIQRADWWGTGLFAVTAVAATVAPDSPVELVAFLVALGLFGAGIVAFVLAYSRAVSRSREDVVAVSNLFFLTGGVAPPAVQRSLLGALGTQVALALGTAIARPYSSLAAGTLVPVYGLSMAGLWASRHGTFPPREAPPAKPAAKPGPRPARPQPRPKGKGKRKR